MNQFLKIALLAIGLIFATLSIAGTGLIPSTTNTPTDQLATCLVDSLNGKDRKNLAKWIFFAMGAHPSITPFMKANASDIEESDQYIGELITKILTVDCPKELKLANKYDPLALTKAFQLVGQVAMQELMNNPSTQKAATNYSKYADEEKINKILSE